MNAPKPHPPGEADRLWWLSLAVGRSEYWRGGLRCADSCCFHLSFRLYSARTIRPQEARASYLVGDGKKKPVTEGKETPSRCFGDPRGVAGLATPASAQTCALASHRPEPATSWRLGLPQRSRSAIMTRRDCVCPPPLSTASFKRTPQKHPDP